MAGMTLDAGGLIAVDSNDRRMLVCRPSARDRRPGDRPCDGACAGGTPTRAAGPTSRLVRQPNTDVVLLDRVDATNIGRLLAASGRTDIVDAHVVICARRGGNRSLLPMRLPTSIEARSLWRNARPEGVRC